MFLDIDQIRGQISANITVLSQPPADYKNLDKLQAMLADSVAQIKEAINADNEEMLTVLSLMIEYQKNKLDKIIAGFGRNNKSGYTQKNMKR
jgi:hypothetical protein